VVRENRADPPSPLAAAVRRGLIFYLRQKERFGPFDIEVVLRQWPTAVEQMLLTALDDLVREGKVATDVSECGDVAVVWCGGAGRAA
jgi:hypothetical protein